MEFASFSQEALLGSGSDHIHIFLRSNTTHAGPFKFEFMWLEVPGFKDLLEKWWEEFVVEGYASYRFGQKLKLLKLL